MIFNQPLNYHKYERNKYTVSFLDIWVSIYHDALLLDCRGKLQGTWNEKKGSEESVQREQCFEIYIYWKLP